MSFARRSLQVLALVCTLVIGTASMAVIVTQTTWFKEWLRGFIVRQAEDYVNGRLTIGRIDGNLFFGVELEDVDVTMNGLKVVEVKDVGLDYNAFTFIAGDVVLDDIRLNRPTLRVARQGDGWNLTQLIKARTPDPDEPKGRRPIEIGEIGVTDGTLLLEDQPVGTSGIAIPERIEKLNASVGVKSDEHELRVEIGHLSLRAEGPRFGVNALSGVVRRSPDYVQIENLSLRTEESSLRVHGSIRNIESGTPAVDITASSDKLAIDEIARLVPALRGYELQPQLQVTARGPADRMAVDLNARGANLGSVVGDLTVDAVAPSRRVAGTVSMEHLNVGPLARSATLKSDITGRATVDLALPSDRFPMSGSYSVDASRATVAGYEVSNLKARGRIDDNTIRLDADATAYGGRATAQGSVVTGDALRLDLEGRASNVNLRSLPRQLNAPGVPSDLNLDYRLVGRGRVFSGDVRLHTSTLAGATIAPGTTATFTVGGGAPTYSASGSFRDLDLQRVGGGFGVRALGADRFKSRLTAAFDIKGSGGGSFPLNLDASGVIADSELFGASLPRFDFNARFAGTDAQVRAIGQFAGLDPAVVSGNEEYQGKVAGAVDVNATLRNYRSGVTLDTIDASGRINLGQSQVAGFSLDSAVVDGRYGNRTGELNQISITGPDLNVQGQGMIALNDTGASNLNLKLQTPSLDRIGKVIDKPLKGAAVIDATVTGNARELKVVGTLDGSNIGYGENEALNLDARFAVSIPELKAGEASVEAQSTATFLEVGGQKITQLTADTTYANSRLEFQATAQEGVRHLATGGSVVLHPDHQEIHLGDLALRSEAIEWRMAPGTEARIQYGADRIAVRDVRLVSGEQRIEADGALGSTRDALKVTLSNVDVAQLDALMLADQRIAGRLNARATLSGPKDALRVDGTFSLEQGAFRTFMFDSLGGTVAWNPRGAEVDVRLQQNPQSWLTAKGFVPTAFVRPGERPTAHDHQPPRPGEAIDLQVASSQIDLGVIQGFTSYLTKVTGTLQANIRVTGSAHDPHMDGAVEVRGGAFEIPAAGTRYTGFDTRIDLKPDAVQISEMRILDEHQNALRIGGSLAVHEREVGAVNVQIQSENFEAIDNELADIKLDSNLRITGELRAPRVEGQIELENATVDVARVIELTGSDPYALEAAKMATAPAAPGAAPPAEQQPSVFDALTMNVAVSVPSNLVLRGSDLRPANAPISIGDVNLTVGGLLSIRKDAGQKMRILGEVNTVRGRYDFQGRRFELMRDGRVRFQGSEEINPLLDLRARRVISGVETFVRVRGTMQQPELSFSSNPPLDEADILSLIVFNQPINQLGEGQQVSLAERAGALAGGYLASGLAQSIGNALELDEFEIQATGDRGEGPSLTIGEQVGEKLFVRVRQGFGAQQSTEFILEYQIAEYLRAQASVAEVPGGTGRAMFRRVERGGVDLIFFFSY